MTTVLVLGAGGSAAENFVDALRRSERGYRVVGADASPVKLHLSSADERVVIPRAGAQGYADSLVALIGEYACDVVHPQPDPDVRAIGALRNRMPAATYLPAQEALECAGDKVAFSERMRASAVAVPDSVSCTSLDDVAPAIEKLRAEHDHVWIRARVGAGARASLPVRTAAQAEAWVRWWVDERGMDAADFMLSEMLPGREFAYQSVWQDGELVAGQARERVEYLYGHLAPSGQTSTPAVARTIAEREIDGLAQRAIRALDPSPRGVYCVDMKEGADGAPKVTEINAGRFFTTSNFFAAAGLNMPDMLVQCALGARPERRGTSPLPNDLYWVRMVDMGYALVRGDELDRWPRPRA